MVKRLAWSGPRAGHQFIDRLRIEMAIGDFLQFGLVIALGRRPADIVGEQALDHPLRRVQSAISIYRANDRLERRRQNRSLVASAALLFALARA